MAWLIPDRIVVDVNINVPAFSNIVRLLGEVMETQAELAQQLTAIGGQITALDAQVTKVAGETAGLKQKIVDLEAIIAAGGPITPELQASAAELVAKVGGLQSSVQTLDDMVPDPPPPSA